MTAAATPTQGCRAVTVATPATTTTLIAAALELRRQCPRGTFGQLEDPPGEGI